MDPYKWKDSRLNVIQMSDRSVAYRKDKVASYSCITVKEKKKKKDANVGTFMIPICVFTLLFLGFLYGIGRESAQAAMINAGQPSVSPTEEMNIGNLADYVFIVAIPFALLILVYLCASLSKISNKLGHGNRV